MFHGTALLVERDSHRRDALICGLSQSYWAILAVSDPAIALHCLETRTFDLLIFNVDLLSSVHWRIAARYVQQCPNVITIWYNGSFPSPCYQSHLSERGGSGSVQAIIDHIQQQVALHAAQKRKHLAEPQAQATYEVPVPLLVDPYQGSVFIADTVIKVSKGDIALLRCLAESPHQKASFEALAAVLYPHAFSRSEARELIKARIHYLRQKLEVDPDKPVICSIRGFGYALRSPVAFLPEQQRR